MKVYLVEYLRYESSEVIGLCVSEELAQEYIKRDIQQKWGDKAKIARYEPSYYIKEMEVFER